MSRYSPLILKKHNMVSSEGVVLKELYIEDVDSNQKVCIQAITAALIEKIASRMLLEPGVTAAG